MDRNSEFLSWRSCFHTKNKNISSHTNIPFVNRTCVHILARVYKFVSVRFWLLIIAKSSLLLFEVSYRVSELERTTKKYCNTTNLKTKGFKKAIKLWMKLAT